MSRLLWIGHFKEVEDDIPSFLTAESSLERGGLSLLDERRLGH